MIDLDSYVGNQKLKHRDFYEVLKIKFIFTLKERVRNRVVL